MLICRKCIFPSPAEAVRRDTFVSGKCESCGEGPVDVRATRALDSEPDTDVFWTPFVVTSDGLVKEPTGPYGMDLFPKRFESLDDFIQFMKRDKTPDTYDGEFILLPVVSRRTHRKP